MDIPSLCGLFTWGLDLILVGLSQLRIFQDFCIKQIPLTWIHWISRILSHQIHAESWKSPEFSLACSSRASSLWPSTSGPKCCFFFPKSKSLWVLWVALRGSAWPCRVPRGCHRGPFHSAHVNIHKNRLNLRQNKQKKPKNFVLTLNRCHKTLLVLLKGDFFKAVSTSAPRKWVGFFYFFPADF